MIVPERWSFITYGFKSEIVTFFVFFQKKINQSFPKVIQMVIKKNVPKGILRWTNMFGEKKPLGGMGDGIARVDVSPPDIALAKWMVGRRVDPFLLGFGSCSFSGAFPVKSFGRVRPPF